MPRRSELPLLVYLWLKTCAVVTRGGLWILLNLPRWLGGRPFIPPTRKFTIPSSKDRERRIDIWVYSPRGGEDRDRKQKLPVHINFHGSGFVYPMHGTDSEFCTQISKSLNCIVLDAGYAKAPEYPFPAAFHDVEDVLSYVLSSPEGLYDTERITIGGFSAGATLALGVAGCSPIANGTVKGVVAFYPGTDFTKNGWDLDKISPAPGPPKLKANRSLVRARFSPSSINFFQKCYVPPSISKTDPRLSPVFIPPSNLPPMLVFAAGYDSLRKSAEDFAMSVKAGGGKIAWKTFENVGHYWDKLANPRMKEYEDRNEAYSMSVAFLKECFGERRGSL